MIEDLAHEGELEAQLMGIENLALDDVPQGEDEAGNVELRRWGTPRQINSAREHFELPGVAAGMDFETAAKKNRDHAISNLAKRLLASQHPRGRYMSWFLKPRRPVLRLVR